MLSNSWIIVSKATGKPVLETYSEKIAASVNRECYEVLSAHEWLVRFNATVKAEG